MNEVMKKQSINLIDSDVFVLNSFASFPVLVFCDGPYQE